jgi:hypothetical protein
MIKHIQFIIGKNAFRKTISFSIIILLLFLIRGNCFSQNIRPPQQQQQENMQHLTTKQINDIKSILSNYKPSTITAEQVSEINEKFRAAGIYPSPQTKDAIIAAGFNPDKFRPSRPQQTEDRRGDMGAPQKEDREKMIREMVIEPLSLSASQKVSVNKIYADFFAQMDKIMSEMDKQERDKQERERDKQGKDRQGREKSKQQDLSKLQDVPNMESLEKARDSKIKTVLSKEQFKKYEKLNNGFFPPRTRGNAPHQQKT